MAGDWIKLEKATFEKPEVVAMADILDMPEPHVVGCLLWVWSWFDTHTENGHAPSVTVAFLNRRVCVTGFAEAMLSTGWLVESEGEKRGLMMPHFERHNSKSAKKRALASERKRKERVTQVSRSERDKGVTREEKRREEKRREEKEKSSGDGKPQGDFQKLIATLAALGFEYRQVRSVKGVAMVKRWAGLGVTPTDLTELVDIMRKRYPDKSFGPTYLDAAMEDYKAGKIAPGINGKRPEWARIPRGDDELWSWAKQHGYPDPGRADTNNQYRAKLRSYVEKRLAGEGMN